MSKVVFIDPIDHISGKICSHSDVIFAHRSGSNKNYTTRICNPRNLTNKPYSEDEQACKSLFATAAANTKEVMTNATKLATARAQFAANPGKYTTLRGFVFAREYAAAQEAED